MEELTVTTSPQERIRLVGLMIALYVAIVLGTGINAATRVLRCAGELIAGGRK